MSDQELVRHVARDGSPLALTIDECVLLDKIREGVLYIPRDKFSLVEEALERLGKLSIETAGSAVPYEPGSIIDATMEALERHHTKRMKWISGQDG